MRRLAVSAADRSADVQAALRRAWPALAVFLDRNNLHDNRASPAGACLAEDERMDAAGSKTITLTGDMSAHDVFRAFASAFDVAAEVQRPYDDPRSGLPFAARDEA